ncbi:MAG: HCO3- transporter [Myxococcales bacterium]|nr:HCO3- transporter [Myxococcales bacterium]MCB9644224.1 HCO3- transporter [Myxococcales bacterium]
MEDAAFREQALALQEVSELAELYQKSLNEKLHFSHIPPELQATGQFLGGVKQDLARRAPLWKKDFSDGFHPKVLASIFFMFFACLAAAVAFGALTSTLTGGQIGVVETILASAIGGILWSVFAGQPLVIVGATGPNIIFIGILYALCKRYGLPFLPTAMWVGLWSMLYMWILAATDASALIRFFTRFTDEIFAALISMIFIIEAVKDMMVGFRKQTASHDSALLSLFLALSTFVVAMTLSRMRRTPFLRFHIREFLSDFGPSIALIFITYVAYQFKGISFETLTVPPNLSPSIQRSWLVNPFDAPVWVWLAAAFPAILLTILVWVNQNITARLVNSADHKLKKGAAYHWDIAVTGTLVGLMSCFGLPWIVGAAVRSLNHTRSLLVMNNNKTEGTIENRLSNLGVHLLIGCSLLLLPLLKMIPMSVLFGLFLFMGFGSLGGNQFMERLRLWVLDPKLYEVTHHLRVVPLRTIHLFTFVQLLCFVFLWFIKESALGILFPLFVALLIPIRMLLGNFMKPEHLALLDIEERAAEDIYRDIGT